MTQEAGLVPQKDITFVSKPWGWEEWTCNNEKYCGKILFIKKGHKLSWHRHDVKMEHFRCWSGEVLVYYSWDDDLETAKEQIIKPGDVFFVPTGLRHRLVGLMDSYIIEFSTMHFDVDSIRLIPGG